MYMLELLFHNAVQCTRKEVEQSLEIEQSSISGLAMRAHGNVPSDGGVWRDMNQTSFGGREAISKLNSLNLPKTGFF